VQTNRPDSFTMNNNDVLRKIRYSFDYSDDQMIAIFELVDVKVTRAEVSDWLKRDDDEEVKELPDLILANFLNGFIVEKRGKKEGSIPVAEASLDNNLILKKLKIALDLKTDDMLALFESVDLKVGPHELTALLRNPKQKQYRPCKDQFLRNFLFGVEKKYRVKK
jgi:uncharacterized protein YehS (DUF1456 family)